MADVPYSLASDNEKEFLDNTLKLMRDLTEQRIGNSPIADVFAAPADVLTLQIKENSGLYKNDDDELDINVTASCISNTPAGNIGATNVQAAINELDGDKISNDGSGNCLLGVFKLAAVANILPDYNTVFVPNFDDFILYTTKTGPIDTGNPEPYRWYTIYCLYAFRLGIRYTLAQYEKWGL